MGPAQVRGCFLCSGQFWRKEIVEGDGELWKEPAQVRCTCWICWCASRISADDLDITFRGLLKSFWVLSGSSKLSS